jgi:signal transduction histidine kinase
MRLKLKFVLIRMFILVLPIIVAFSIFVTMRLTLGEGLDGKVRYVTVDAVVSEFKRSGRLDGIRERISPATSFIVADSSGRVVETNVNGIRPGEAVDPGRLAGSDYQNASIPQYAIVEVSREGETFTVLVSVPGPWSLPQQRRFFFVILIAACAILATSFLSSLMLGRTLRSLNTLKEASTRIAAGDLDHSWELSRKDEIGELSESFETMRRSLKEERTRRSMFLMAVTHDLRTPLTSIRGYLDVFSDGMAESEGSREKYLGILRDKARLLEARIAELLDYVRMETGEWKLKIKPLAIAPFLKELGSCFSDDGMVANRKIEFESTLPDGLSVRADEGLLCRVMENLVHNAFRYSASGDIVTLSAGLSGGRVRVEVSNTGQGIPESDRDNIFQPFYRGSRSRNEPGFGLGLSIVKSIIDAHGWTIELTAEKEKTIFRIEMPLEAETST